MAKGNKKNTEVIETVESSVENTEVIETKEHSIEKSNLDEKTRVNIVLLASSKLVKVDTDKRVSGSVANVLINKGFAKLKN